MSYKKGNVNMYVIIYLGVEAKVEIVSSYIPTWNMHEQKIT